MSSRRVLMSPQSCPDVSADLWCIPLPYRIPPCRATGQGRLRSVFPKSSGRLFHISHCRISVSSAFPVFSLSRFFSLPPCRKHAAAVLQPVVCTRIFCLQSLLICFDNNVCFIMLCCARQFKSKLSFRSFVLSLYKIGFGSAISSLVKLCFPALLLHSPCTIFV